MRAGRPLRLAPRRAAGVRDEPRALASEVLSSWLNERVGGHTSTPASLNACRSPPTPEPPSQNLVVAARRRFPGSTWFSWAADQLEEPRRVHGEQRLAGHRERHQRRCHLLAGALEVLDRQALAEVDRAIAALLEMEDDLEVVAEVSRGDEVVDAALRHVPDVALLDVEMPGIDGLAAARLLKKALPSCRVLMVTTFGRPGYLKKAMAAGASGFVVKDTPARALADAVRRVHDGLRVVDLRWYLSGKTGVVDPTLAAESLTQGDSPLTDRESDVLQAARDGGTVADIAGMLFLSEGTVRNHLSSAIGKTGARTRAEAVRVAVDNGWLLPH